MQKSLLLILSDFDRDTLTKKLKLKNFNNFEQFYQNFY
jgi:hypothetical protein